MYLFHSFSRVKESYDALDNHRGFKKNGHDTVDGSLRIKTDLDDNHEDDEEDDLESQHRHLRLTDTFFPDVNSALFCLEEACLKSYHPSTSVFFYNLTPILTSFNFLIIPLQESG